jgi:uncharacterized protein (TIGR03435 family)
MKKWMLWMIALALPGGLFAQNVPGTWQGTLHPPQGKDLRIVIKISRADNESLKAVFYSIDQPVPPFNANAISQQGATVKISVSTIGGEYEGKLSGDGNSITGTWMQGPASMALNLARATPETAWAIPEPPPPPKLLPADANPTFEVATIKPTDPNRPGMSIQVLPGGAFATRHTSLSNLIQFAYQLHGRQITGGPAWMETEYYDVNAKPDQEGFPNDRQMRAMVQKLLAERFELAFHHDKKELAVYLITVGKGGAKLTQSQGNGTSLPGFGMRGLGDLLVRNATILEFAQLLQQNILERPVVDQTGLTARYDFTLKWTPDQSQFGGRGGNAPPPPEGTVPPPDLYNAIEQQLGLKLESTKAPVDVLVIDRVEKPSEN